MIFQKLHFAVQDAVIPRSPRLIILNDGQYVGDTGMMSPDEIKDLIEQLLKAALDLNKPATFRKIE